MNSITTYYWLKKYFSEKNEFWTSLNTCEDGQYKKTNRFVFKYWTFPSQKHVQIQFSLIFLFTIII